METLGAPTEMDSPEAMRSHSSSQYTYSSAGPAIPLPLSSPPHSLCTSPAPAHFHSFLMTYSLPRPLFSAVSIARIFCPTPPNSTSFALSAYLCAPPPPDSPLTFCHPHSLKATVSASYSPSREKRHLSSTDSGRRSIPCPPMLEPDYGIP